MRVLVTGGLGFVGSHIVDQLLDDGHEVVIVDSIEPDAHRVRPEPDARAENREHSVCDLDAMLAAVTGLRRRVPPGGEGRPGRRLLRCRSRTCITTISALRRSSGRLHEADFRGRYVFASSMVVYGEGAYACANHGSVRPGPRAAATLQAGQFEPPCPQCGEAVIPATIPETAPLSPRNVYAATKLHQEHLAEAFAIEHPDVVTTALRYHNVYGPRMPRDTPYAGVASIFRSALARGDSPTGLRGRRPAPRLRPRRRRRHGPTFSHSPAPGRSPDRSTSPAARHTRSSRWPTPSPMPPVRVHRVRRRRGLAPGRCPSRHRVTGPGSDRARVHGRDRLRHGHATARDGGAAHLVTAVGTDAVRSTTDGTGIATGVRSAYPRS